MQAVAGVALLGTLGAALTAAIGPGGDTGAARPHETTAAVATVLTAASGATFLGVGAAFWALVVGIGILLVLRRRRTDTPTTDEGRRTEQ